MMACLSISARRPCWRWSPTSAAFFTSDSRSSSIVAIAAAHDTGLPPKVLACAPGGHAITSDRAMARPAAARGDALGQHDQVRHDTPKCSGGEHLAGAAHARLDLVEDQQDAVFVADVPQALQELAGGHDVAALALDGLEHDGGDLVRRDEVHEHLVLAEVDASAVTIGR